MAFMHAAMSGSLAMGQSSRMATAALRRELLFGSSIVALEYLLGASEKVDSHKDLWPLDWRDWLGFSLSAFSLFIAAGGGIGGGAVLVPVNLIVLGFRPSYSVALSNITIVGGAISNFVFNVARRHPSGKRPLIDWDLIMVMEPSTILGALIGGYVNQVMPGWLTTVLLSLLLTFLSTKLWKRGISTFKKETNQLGRHASVSSSDDGGGDGALTVTNGAVGVVDIAAGAGDTGDGTSEGDQVAGAAEASFRSRRRSFRRINSAVSASEDTSSFEQAHSKRRLRAPASMNDVLLADAAAVMEEARGRNGTGGGGGLLTEPLLATVRSGEPPNAAAAAADDEAAAKLQQILKREAQQVPVTEVAVLFLLMGVVMASDSLKHIFPCGTAKYWAVTLAVVPISLGVAAVTAWDLVRRHGVKLASKHLAEEGEVEWTPRNTVVYPAVCTLAGLVAGMFGVGGGIVKGPLMLEMGILPDVAAATSATMIMFTAAAASAVYISFGNVKNDYAVASFLMGLIVTMIGQVAAHHLMSRLQRRSIIIFCMASLMGVATVVMYLESFLRIRWAERDGALWEWHRICS